MNDVNTKNDTINRQAAIDALKRISFSHRFEYVEYLSEDTREIEIINSNKALEAIEALPSAQPERDQGHWIGIDDEPCETWECDKCGCIQECFDGEQPNYCQNCGADMREVNDDKR